MTRTPVRARRMRVPVSILLEQLENRYAPALFGPIVSSPNVGDEPQSMAVGDFDNDGRLDLAVVNGASNNLTVLLGDGTGQFLEATGSPINVGTNPIAVTSGDLNRDGRPDLAVANYGSNSVTVLIGDGSGGFAGTSIAVGSNPLALVAGDFSGDGMLDLAVANSTSNSVSILIGNGKGAFTAAPGSPVTVGTSPSSLATGDFNSDKKTDLAVVNIGSGNVTVLLGNGSAGFAPAAGSPAPAGKLARSVIAADFNGDQKVDLVVVNSGDNKVATLLGDGNGAFAPAPGSPFAVGIEPVAANVADFNGDGNLDLAVTNRGSNDLSVLIGTGAGGFTNISNSPIAIGLSPVGVVIGDFNGDGKTDLAVVNEGDDNVAVLMNQASKTTTVVESSAPSAVFGQPITFTATVTADSGDPTAGTVIIRNGAAVLGSAPVVGGVATIQFQTLGAGNYSITASFSSDAFYASFSAPIPQSVAKAATDVAISTDPALPTNGRFVTLKAVVDSATVIKATGTVTFFDDATKLGTVFLDPSANATFLAQLEYGDRKIRAVYSGDSNFLASDSNSDVTVSASAKKYVTGPDASGGPHVNVYNLDGSLDRSFFAYSALFKGGVRVATGDVNGDGSDDIITGPGPGGGPHIRVFDGNSGGEIRSFFAYAPNFRGGVFVAAGDVNDDGKADVIVAPGRGVPRIRVFSGADGTELFNLLAYAPRMGLGVRVAAGDVNNDGKDDIIVAAGPGVAQKVRVLDATGKHPEILSFLPYGPRFRGGVFVAGGDVDGDGVADVIVSPGQNRASSVLVFSGKTKAQMVSLTAYGEFLGGAAVAAQDIDGDGKADIITGPKLGGGPHVRIFSGADATAIAGFFAYHPSFIGGIWVG